MLWLIWLVLMLIIAAAPAVLMFREQQAHAQAHAEPGDGPTDAH